MDVTLTGCARELVESIREFAPADVVSVEVFINCEGHNITIRTRTQDDLKKAGISMRNLKGDFIGSKENK